MTNMVYFKFVGAPGKALEYVPRFAKEGVLLLATPEVFRFVCHNAVRESDIPRILQVVENVFGNAA